MRNLTPEEIERFVEAQIKATSGYLCLDEIEVSTTSDLLRTALATVTLDQPRVDLKEVERLVHSDAVYNSMDIDQEKEIEEAHRKAIGYTLDDLNK